MKFAQLVIGPAGSGKSTFCETMKQFCDASGRSLHIVNLGMLVHSFKQSFLVLHVLIYCACVDPAAEEFTYPVSVDIRELICLEDAMVELGLGPNGALLYCMEYMEENLQEWLQDELSAYGDDDYLLFDCPGQIELYSHLSVFQTFVRELKLDGWNVGCIYCLDSQFMEDASKYISGCLTALASMIQLELPHLNVLTKVDLLGTKVLNDDPEDGIIIPDPTTLVHSLDASSSKRFHKLNAAIASLLDDYSMVGFVPLDITDEESIEACMLQADTSVQYGEDQDVKIQPDADCYE